MKIKTPARIERWIQRLDRQNTRLRFVPVVLLSILICLCVYVFYSLSIVWFKYEFVNATDELARKRAASSAQVIGQTLSETLSGKRLSLGQERWAKDSLGDLMQQNPNIIAAMIIDANGRISLISVARGAVNSELLKKLDLGGRSLRGFDEAHLLNSLRLEHPNLESIRVDIYQNGRPIGWLRLLVDRTLSPEAVEVAAARMTARLTMLLLALAILITLAIAIIRRQQRIARHLIAQRNEAERLAYVGALAAGLAHEIRNPLNALAMQLELLEEDVGDGESQLVSPRLQRIRKGLAGVERTVHDFLNYATPNQQKPSLVELAEVIQSSCAGLRESAQVPLKVECTVAPGLKAWCDPHALRQILGNLFINAVRAQKGREATPSLRVEAVRNGSWIDILVDDAGPGVPPEHRQHVFDAFYTTHSEGTGLGLPIGRRLAEMNGGRLELANEPSSLGGARFILRLAARPAVRKPGKAQPASRSMAV